MAWTRMSERELRRVEVLNEVHSGRRTVAAAASVLSTSEWQAYRLLARYQEKGGFGLVHKARGRTSNRSHNPGVRKVAVELVKTHYADFGPTLAVHFGVTTRTEPNHQSQADFPGSRWCTIISRLRPAGASQTRQPFP